MTARLFTYSATDKARIINFIENIYHIRLRELRSCLRFMKTLDEIVEPLQEYMENFKSPRLKALLRRKDELDEFKKPGFLPDIQETVESLENLLEWKTVQTCNSGEPRDIPIPKKGMNGDFDEARKLVVEEEKRMEDYLLKLKERFNK